jgi:hypothetical protein
MVTDRYSRSRPQIEGVFVPTQADAHTLKRISEGLTTTFEQHQPLVYVGLVNFKMGPSAGSDLYLTETGEIALDRARKLYQWNDPV